MKNSQKGSVAIILGVALTVILLLGAWLFSTYIYYSKIGNTLETTLVAANTASESRLSNYGAEIAEMSQVSGMYKKDVTELAKASIGGRYGPEGSKALFQFIKEHNPTLDSAIYLNIQNAIRAGRADFVASQKAVIDQKRKYEEMIGRGGFVWSGFWLKIAGFPTINLADIKVVSDDATAAAFSTGRQKPLKLNSPE